MPTAEDVGLLPTQQPSSGKKPLIIATILLAVLSCSLLSALVVTTVMHNKIYTVRSSVVGHHMKSHAEFANYMATHGKQYTPDEYPSRFKIFHDNMKFANETNEAVGYQLLGPNVYADMTFDEFAERMKLRSLPVPDSTETVLNMFHIDQEVDWRKKGVVTRVKDQGSCGSCWAFSTTGGIESANIIKTNVSKEVSEQQLVDCSKNGNYGCDGGNVNTALDYVIANGGICSEEEYGYAGRDQSCRPCTPIVQVDHYKHLPSQDTMQFLLALNQQPISISVGANIYWQLYFGGIFKSAHCPDVMDQLNHAVLAIGYKLDDYILVKNSWGTGWGEDGYIRLEFPKGDTTPGPCGSLLDNYYPIIKA